MKEQFMKLKITQTIIEIEWPDKDSGESRVYSGKFPPHPRPSHLATHFPHKQIDEDAYSRVIEMW
ncbi:MAG: hypothetical protein ACRC2T_03705, partial [Thermoguttaceae bacterium]